jgi:exonuclease III
MDQVMLLGDLNETLTQNDRYPKSIYFNSSYKSSLQSSPIMRLQQQGFIDVYRNLFQNSITHPGFTHTISTPLVNTFSRIDYIWTRGFKIDSLSSIHVDKYMIKKKLSHHGMVILQIRIVLKLYILYVCYY